MITGDELKGYSYFEKMGQDCRDEAARRIETVVLPPGSVIIKQNTPADALYFVKKGRVRITRRTRHGLEAKITDLETGKSFGEMALLTCSHRTSTVIAITEVTLLRLNRNDFDTVIMMDSTLKSLMKKKIGEYEDYNQIKTLQPLALLDPQKMPALMEKFNVIKIPVGDVIIREGETGANYYLIKNGKACVQRNGEFITTITTGDAFGEEAIIRDHKRSATISALTDITLLSLNKADFNALLKESFLDFTFPEDISEEDMAGYVFIDARIPPEYKEEHIAGAINIPLEIIRQKFPELDPDQQYITYCTNDSRGMAAAFLMSVQGFNARSLRGGLSGWEGPLVNDHDGIHYPDHGGLSPEEEDAMLAKFFRN